MKSLKNLVVAIILLGPGASAAAVIDYEFSGSNFGPFGSAGEPSIPGLVLSGMFSVEVDEADGTIVKLLAFSFQYDNPPFLFGMASYGLGDVVFDTAPAISNPNAGIFAPPRSSIGGDAGGLDPLTVDAGPAGGDFVLSIDHIADPALATLTAFQIVWPDGATASNAGAFFTDTLYGASNVSLTGVVVPLPAALPLMGVALGMLGCAGRRARSRGPARGKRAATD